MNEMEKLKQWLLQEKIHFEYFLEPLLPDILEKLEEYDLISNDEMKLSRNQILLSIQYENGYDLSVICQYGSYGVKQGLLEYCRLKKKEDPVGYCTAEEVIEVIKELVKEIPCKEEKEGK